MITEEKKKRIKNFWYYYKWHIIIGIVVTFFIAYIASDMITNVNPDLSIDIIMDSGFTYDVAEDVTRDLETNGVAKDNNGDGKIKSEVTIMQTGSDPSDMSGDTSMMEIVQLRMTVGEASVIITEPYILDLYGKHDVFEDLTAIADEMNIPLHKRYMSEDGKKVVAINIDGCEFLSRKNIEAKDCYIAHRVLNYNQHDDKTKTNEHTNATDVIKYIIK